MDKGFVCLEWIHFKNPEKIFFLVYGALSSEIYAVSR